jgi:aryl-alcohol dehydrogenase-like predicted oxidoreductase
VIAKEKDASLAQIALAWVLAKGDDIIPIPGTKKLSRLSENLGALDVALSDDDLKAIEDAVPADAVAGPRYPETTSSTLNA